MFPSPSYRSFIFLPLLFIPAIAMQFTEEVQWSLGDFMIMGLLLLFVGTTLEVLRKKIKSSNRRRLWGLIVFIVFFLLWAEMAVGIFGSAIAGD